ncbi:MAG: 16S rRNA (cytosine(1402)-N(4))-methyltransferase RsmH [Candidatus Jorgensenbacteria bacterium]|nr:16S rRNA (cytosine(1402)-N(4))-methyltransferase RsmH [Candidatus Jorgensenbacteria bacterium]
MTIHKPVLLHETIEILSPQSGEFFIDGTLGGGGHANAILDRIGKSGTLLGIDWDADAISRFEKTNEGRAKIFVRNSNYNSIPKILTDEKMPKADGLLLDLGFSSFQIEDASRGFSFQSDGPLDMRYSREGLTAAEVVNGFREEELADIFWKFGDESFSRQIAKKIVEERRKERILTTGRLRDVVVEAFPVRFRNGRVSPATKVFQALRIYVNKEFENIESILGNLSECVKSGGRVAVITFHSSEDGIVKKAFQGLVKSGIAELINKKPIAPTREEVLENPRSRSAKLRAIKLK